MNLGKAINWKGKAGRDPDKDLKREIEGLMWILFSYIV